MFSVLEAISKHQPLAMVMECDIAVVGAGAAGCILAARLAAASTARVLLIEAGSSGDEPRFIDPSIASIFQIWFTESDWQLQTVPQNGLHDRVVTINQGKVLGGGTAVNAMMYVRGHPANFEEWFQLSGHHPLWSPASLQSSFFQLEKCMGFEVDPALRGSAGPIGIRQTPRPSRASSAFLEACKERGYHQRDFNAAPQEDSCDLMQLILMPDGTRCSTSRAFLSSPLAENLTVLTDHRVSSLVMDGETCSQLILSDGSVVRAGRVVLCAGALQTPALLIRSGIGDPEQLQACDLPCHVANPWIGRNLSDHMRVMVAYRSQLDPGVTEFLCEASLFTRSGLLTSPETDLQINFSAGVEGFVPPEFTQVLPESLDRFVIFVPIITRPQSRGSITPQRDASSGEITFAIDPAYLTDPLDISVYRKGLDLCRDLARTVSLSPYCVEEVCPAGLFDDTEYLRRYATTIWHPVGTCSVGDSSGSSACTPDFKVVGTENIYVADASIIPTLPSGNPQAAVFAIANLAANSLMGEG